MRRIGRVAVAAAAVVMGAAAVHGLAGPPAAAEDSSRNADSSWSIVPSANTSPDESNRLQDVDCTDAGECVAVGFSPGCLEARTPVIGAGICNQHRTLIEHWDGAEWRIVETPNPSPHANQLWGVECVSANDCWAVGNYTGAAGAWTLILRWEGSNWNLVPSPTPASPLLDGRLQSITCVAPDDCWAVGSGSNKQVSSDRLATMNPVALHWDGTTWTIVPTPNQNTDQSHFLEDVTCLSAQDCWAVGHSTIHSTTEGDRFRTLALHWDGVTWSVVGSPNPGPAPGFRTGDRLHAVACTTAGDCWAVGESGGSFDNTPLTLRWDGTTWSIVPTPSGRGSLEDVTCPSVDRCWAVGGSGVDAGVGVRIMKWDGAGWRFSPSPGGALTLSGLTCLEQCWAVGHHQPGFAPGPRASINQTLVLSTMAVDHGDGEHSLVDPAGDESWVARYDGPMGQLDAATAAGVSPDGARVFVTGASVGRDQREDFATVAYDAADGSPRWLARYAGPTGYGVDEPVELAVSPDGSRVFVTGASEALFDDRETGRDIATVAYDASDGRQLWTARYDGPAAGDDRSPSVAVSADGSRVFVTGRSQGDSSTGYDFATVAYDAVDGRELWVARFNGPGNSRDLGADIGVGAAGVFVTGSSAGEGTGIYDFATVAYDPVDGRELWVSRYNGPANGWDVGRELAVSPDGARVYVAGESNGGSDPNARSGRDYATIAYDAATGGELWVGRYDGPGRGEDVPTALMMSPDGAGLYVSGGSKGADDLGQETDWDYATVAYDARAGTERWVARYDGPLEGLDVAYAMAVSADGSRVFVTGASEASSGDQETGYRFATVEYDAADGSELWDARHTTSMPFPLTTANVLAVSPDGGGVFIAGRRQSKDRGAPGHEDFLTIAYDRGPSEPREDTELSFTDDSAASGQYSDEVTFEARLTDSAGDPMKDAALTFTLAGEGMARDVSATTDEDGVASVTLRLGQQPGAYQLAVRFDGDEERAASADTVAFTVDKEDTDTELTVMNWGENMTLRSQLSDLDTSGDKIAGRTIDFFSDGEAIGSAQTGSDGIAQVPVPPGHRGANRTYEAVFAGDGFFRPSSDVRPGIRSDGDETNTPR